MIRSLFIVILFQGSMSAQDLGRGWAWAGIAAATLDHQNKPMPSPAPNPGDKCQTCNGTGKVGDGKVFATCRDCNGTGKVIALPVSVIQQQASDLLLEPAIKSSIPKIQSCPGGVCQMPFNPVKTYTQPQPATVKRGWFFRR